MNDDRIVLLSVGIDIGSSTSHLVFSNITLERNEHSYSRRFEIVDRKVVFSSIIIDTPLLNPTTIDVKQLVKFLQDQYELAKITKEQVQTGVVIVTGETAKKENAKEIVETLAEDAGSFVAATAGPNFESLIAAYGSGAVQRSEREEIAILSCDIGGGTSNIAISKGGLVQETSCISVGGRLIAFDKDRIITRIDGPGRLVLDELGLNLNIGSEITETQQKQVAERLATALLNSITRNHSDKLVDKLLMTENVSIPISEIDEVFYSGGVSEFVYGSKREYYNDLGYELGKAIKVKTEELGIQMFEPENKIRATVIGAGNYTLQVSGSTCFLDDMDFPIKNIPVLEANIQREFLSEDHVIEEISKAFKRFDFIEGEEIVAFHFKDPVRAAYQKLKTFAISLEKALPNTIKSGIPVILIFERDIGNSVGNVIRRETAIEDNLISIDEIHVKEGDWIDIGKPMVSGQVVPVTVKSLVFSKTNNNNGR